MKKSDTRPRYNPVNERMKYAYRKHIRRVGQKDEKTVISILKHIRGFETFINFAGFEAFNDQIADKYIQDMFKRKLSLSYVTDNLRALKDFLNWLERQRGYRSKINYNHIDYLNVSNNQRRSAKSKQYQKSYTYEQIIKVIREMPEKTILERRNKAIVSLQALCTLRISELRTVTISSLIEEDGTHFVYVCPKNMQVKFAKTRYAVFVPLPDDIKQNVLNWHDYLQSIGFKGNDPLFPAINSTFNSLNLLEANIKKQGIKSDTTIRDIFKKAFTQAGFEYIKPHSFRKTVAKYAQHQSPAFLNAVRQNLGHSNIDTTLNSYGHLSEMEQRKIIAEAEMLF
jgi:integrase